MICLRREEGGRVYYEDRRSRWRDGRVRRVSSECFGDMLKMALALFLFVSLSRGSVGKAGPRRARGVRTLYAAAPRDDMTTVVVGVLFR